MHVGMCLYKHGTRPPHPFTLDVNMWTVDDVFAACRRVLYISNADADGSLILTDDERLLIWRAWHRLWKGIRTPSTMVDAWIEPSQDQCNREMSNLFGDAPISFNEFEKRVDRDRIEQMLYNLRLWAFDGVNITNICLDQLRGDESEDVIASKDDVYTLPATLKTNPLANLDAYGGIEGMWPCLFES